MIRSRSSGAWLLAAAIGLVAGDALAQENRAAARAHFRRGEEFYAREEWQPAFDAYQEAHRAAPLPGFLFNMGQCKRRLGAADEALGYFRSYLEELPDAPNRADAEALIAELEAEVGSAQTEEPPAPPPTEEAAPGQEEAQPPADSGTSMEASISSDDSGPGLGAIGLPTWLLAGGGVVLLGLGGYFALQAAGAEEDLNDGSLDCERALGRCLDLKEEGDQAAMLRGTFLLAGGALLAGAVALAFLDLSTESETPVAVLPAIDAHGLALFATTRW